MLISGGKRTKLPPSLNILKNSLVTIPAPQDGRSRISLFSKPILSSPSLGGRLEGRELVLSLSCIPGTEHQAWHITAAQRGFGGLMHGRGAGLAEEDH